MNQYETQRILEDFEAAGYTIVPFDSPAELYVVNTCSVTSDAERKSLYTTRRARRNNPNAKVVVTGCAAQMAINQMVNFEGADLVIPNPEKLETYARVRDNFPHLKPEQDPPSPHNLSFQGRTRATLKVQDGCSVFCSYCSIPFTRPVMASRPKNEVISEAKRLVEMGYQEIVLTGVLIGSYGEKTGSGGPDLPNLIRQIKSETGVPRIRVSSIEMMQVNDEICALLTEGIIVPHLHIPLQSGDSGVLRDMNRPYSQGDFISLCHRLQKAVPDLAITTDIMVGFPTESEERFQSSVEVCEQVGFLKAHVFTFSPRYGTPADAYGDPVTPQVKAERRQRLAALTSETGRQFAARFTGRSMDVLFEGKEREGLVEGLTANYLTVRVPGGKNLCRTIQKVNISESREGILYGELTAQTNLGLRN